MSPKNREEYIEWAHRTAEEKKTHVSFPTLKYPSLRDEGHKHPVQWLQGKAMDDGAEGLWRVHNGLYDLTQFLDKHPGGAEWLELTEGTDITEAFETHHLDSIAPKMLEKFYVRDAKTPRNSPFTFEEDGFYKTLKREAVEELKKIPRSVKNKSDLIMDFIFVTVLVSSALSVWLKNYWGVMAAYLIASQFTSWTAAAAHNYLHRRDNWRMYYFNFTLWSYRDFRVSHVLSHHLYPNTLMDLEISAVEPIILWNPRKKPIRAYLTFLVELVYFPLLFILAFLKRFILNFVEKGFFKNHYKWHDGLGLLLPVWMYLVSGAPLYDVLVMWMWIICTGSFIFYIIGANAAHHHPDIFHDGHQVSGETVDWGMHELEAVMDRKEINSSFFRVMTFFGDHSLHHIFPTLDHAYLRLLYPVFLRNCEKFKANFRVSNSIDLFIGQLKTCIQQDPKTLD